MAAPEFTEDFFIYPRMLDLATCIHEQLAERGLPVTCFSGIVAGGPPSLESCTCNGGNGMAWVRLVTAYPSSRFPIQSAEPSCYPPLAFQLEAGIARCVPINTNGTPLTVSQQLDATRLQMADMAAMLAAIRCCMGTHDADDNDLDFLIGQYIPMPIQGGIVGGYWNVTVEQGRKPSGV